MSLRAGLVGAGNVSVMWSGHSALAVILMAFIVSGCAGQRVDVEAAEEQKNQQIIDTYSHLTKIFDECVERSARRQYASSGDPNTAIEKGFLACNSEESAVIERLDVGVRAGFGHQQIGPYKFKLKRRLLQIIAPNAPIEPETRRGTTAPTEPPRQ
jgi:hypothetical protein